MATAHLEWTPGGGIQQEIRYKRQTDLTYTFFQSVPGSTSTIDIPNLDENTVYEFLILNKCPFIQQASDSVQRAMVACPPFTIDKAALSMTVSISHENGGINGYKVQLFEMPGESLISEQTITPSSSLVTITFTNLNEGTFYKIVLIPRIGESFIDNDCVVTDRTLKCPEGYILAPDGSYCYKIEETTVIPPAGGTPYSTVPAQNKVYSSLGTYIYEFGYYLDGRGTSARIPITNSFWINGPGDGGNHSLTAGPLNRSAIWASTLPLQGYEDIGFSVCIDLPATKQYYIGIGGDNRCSIVINGVVIVDQDPNYLNLQYGWDTTIPFRIWHIYPVMLVAGPNIIEMIGHNNGGPAALGAEIYNNTATEIIAATSYDDLSIMFSTANHIGYEVQLGTNNLGYSCPPTYSLATCVQPFVCRKILTAMPE